MHSLDRPQNSNTISSNSGTEAVCRAIVSGFYIVDGWSPPYTAPPVALGPHSRTGWGLGHRAWDVQHLAFHCWVSLSWEGKENKRRDQQRYKGTPLRGQSDPDVCNPKRALADTLYRRELGWWAENSFLFWLCLRISKHFSWCKIGLGRLSIRQYL